MKRRARLDYSTDYLPVGHDNNNSSGNQAQSRKRFKKQFCFRSSGLDRMEDQDERGENHQIDRVTSNEESHIGNGNIDCSEKPSNQEQTQSTESKVIDESQESSTQDSSLNDKIGDTIPVAEPALATHSVVELIRKGKLHQYGNFHKYYEHRYAKKWNDPRVAVLKSEWFFNQRVLDIGCNDGQLTLQLAVKYFPRDILGVDIDYQLINNAVENLLVLEKSQSKAKGTVGRVQRQCDEGRVSQQQPLDLQQSKKSISSNSREIQEEDQEEKEKRIKDRLSRLPACFLKMQSKQQQQELVPEESQGQSLEQAKTLPDESLLSQAERKMQDTITTTSTQHGTAGIKEGGEEESINETQRTIEHQQQQKLESNVQESLAQNSMNIEQKEVTTDATSKQILNTVSIIHNQATQPQTDANSGAIASSSHPIPPPLPPVQRIICRFPNNVRFRTENYVDLASAPTLPTEQFDTICCFSTTKWIQLNFGDAGIKRLFEKVYHSLSINGRFLLEPQEWRSYKKKMNFSDEFKATIKGIKLHPGEFVAYLLSTYPFELETTIVPEQETTDKVPGFFKRTVYVFKKIK